MAIEVSYFDIEISIVPEAVLGDWSGERHSCTIRFKWSTVTVSRY